MLIHRRGRHRNRLGIRLWRSIRLLRLDKGVRLRRYVRLNRRGYIRLLWLRVR